MTLAPSTRHHAAQPIPLAILFEDEHLLAIDKQAGLVVHPCYKHPDGSIFNALLWHFRGTGVRPHLLQRLDNDTTGVMLVSKTPMAHARIVRAMGIQPPAGLKKEYLAVVRGTPTPPSGEIALRLLRDPSDTRRVLASDTEGKESLTRYATVGTSRSLEWALVRCEPATGRMHQLRVHLAARGWPIAGDAVYGHDAGTPAGEAPEPPACARQALHAWRVSFAHPVTRVPLTIVAPLPGDMQALLSRCGIDTPVPWNAPTSRNCSSRPPRRAW